MAKPKPARAAKARTTGQLEDELRRIRVGWNSSDREFALQAMLFLSERLFAIEQGVAALTSENAKRAIRAKTRKASAWNRFFAAGMKAGKSPQQIGEEWRARPKAVRSA